MLQRISCSLSRFVPAAKGIVALALAPALLSTGGISSEAAFSVNPNAGPGTVVVHSRFGGQIFGFDIDQNGSEGMLSEVARLPGGGQIAAVETFDQTTGEILKVVTANTQRDEFVTMGVVGASIGLFEREHVRGLYVVKRTFAVVNPLGSNAVTAPWNPPLGSDYIIMPAGVSRSQGTANVAVFAYDTTGNFIPAVFSSNVAANTFGPLIKITDSYDFGSVLPQIAYDELNNRAILGGGNGCFGCHPVIGVVNLSTGAFTAFGGIGFGFINGLALDAEDNLVCTTTEDDAGVEFYHLGTRDAFKVVLPGSASQQLFSGADVQFDSVHKLFLVAQPVSSSGHSGSSIYVFDTSGKLLETLNGFQFSNVGNVIPMHIALHPVDRTGFVDGPSANVNEIQSFTY